MEDGLHAITNLELIDFLRSAIPVNTVELLAAISGTYYLRKTPALKSSKLLVLFLWLVVFVELIGAYPVIAYFTEYRYLPVKGTFFEGNYWLYNPFIILSFTFYIYYFRSYVKNKLWRNTLNYLIYGYVVFSIINLIASDIYLNGYSKFSTIVGSLLVFLSIVVFYFEILKSDVLLNLQRFLPLYISVGILVFNFCITPIDIFSEYFESENTFYVSLKTNIYLFANIFLYSTYIVGFIICSRKMKSY